MKKKKVTSKKLLIFFTIGLLGFLFWMHTYASTIFESPYVSFSPDRKAWTTCAQDQEPSHYPEGTTVETGAVSLLRSLEVGEHYYNYTRADTVPVGRWVAEWQNAQCIHDSYPDAASYHGVEYGRDKCMGYYNSGWIPYCADCDTPVANVLMYMTEEAAASIEYLDVGMGYAYYYCCPHCNNLEQGVELGPHMCKQISWNQYRVNYDVNTEDKYGGYMVPSYHMYNNAEIYEGEQVTVNTGLSRNNYYRTGYEFCGWNTRADGSGDFYADEADIFNLTAYDYFREGEKGSVTLYAQWRRSESTLEIDPAGGTYQGNGEAARVTQAYGTIYEAGKEDVSAPAGFTVSFVTNGGETIAPITGTMHFAAWELMPPFAGIMLGETYHFSAPDGNVDRITARYEPDAITLPDIKRDNYEFGGWYYDTSFQKPAGGIGDKITPSEPLILYAQWVELKLFSEDNYIANGGKGAVDLQWEQLGEGEKVYKVYQQKENEEWQLIRSAEKEAEMVSGVRDFEYTGNTQTYKVPSTGIYNLTAYGAQGENWKEFNGGRGGAVTATFWLTKGEELSVEIGGQDGYNGGGIGEMFGNGGGYTRITSDRKGDLLYAGGGGAATAAGDGGAGGVLQNVTEGTKGEDGGAGGGGGFFGGCAGEVITHSHSDACYYDLNGNLLETYRLVQTSQAADFYNSQDGGSDAGARRTLQLGSAADLIPVSSNATLELEAQYYYYYSNTRNSINDTAGSYLRVYDQNGNLLLSKNAVNGYSGIYRDGNDYYGTLTYVFRQSLNIPEGVTGIYIVFSAHTTCFWSDPYVSMPKANLTGAKILVCGKEEGETESFKPAYGGSSWVNSEECIFYEMESGNHTGDGKVQITEVNVGYQDEMFLSGVSAPDCSIPDMVQQGITVQPVRGSAGKQIKISWEAPSDQGTIYHHKVESHVPVTGTRLCVSNITRNNLITGVTGYYYLTDHVEDTVLDIAKGIFTQEPCVTTTVTNQVQYLHVAAIDGAGNLADTAHIRIDPLEVAWPLYTRKIQMEKGEQVYYEEEKDVYYVRGDGKTPFTMEYRAYMEGTATKEYQQNYIILETDFQGETARNVTYFSNGELQAEDYAVEADLQRNYTAGNGPLERYPYSVIVRKKHSTELEAEQKFLISPEWSGKRFRVIPIAGAEKDAGIIYSDPVADDQNGINIIADGELPEILGMEQWSGPEVIDRNAGRVQVSIAAEDALSGIKEFYVKVKNKDNHLEKIFRPLEGNNVEIDLTESSLLFTGDFTVSAYAVDNVGNVKEVSRDATEFALEAGIERILDPHDPVFKRGESGILSISTSGYADRVEIVFPEELVRMNPQLNRTYVYTDFPEYQKTEQMQFMIPLDTETDQIYTIIIRAYKGECKLEEFPRFAVLEVNGSILDDLRTRLR